VWVGSDPGGRRKVSTGEGGGEGLRLKGLSHKTETRSFFQVIAPRL
jgi:hypothetical protein